MIDFTNTIPPYHDDCRAVIVIESKEINFHGCWCEQTYHLRIAALAGQEYFNHMASCGNDPEKMASFVSVFDESLDDLFEKWIRLTEKALGEEWKINNTEGKHVHKLVVNGPHLGGGPRYSVSCESCLEMDEIGTPPLIDANRIVKLWNER